MAPRAPRLSRTMPSTNTATAINALLATMTSAQRVALMDALSMHIENVETDDSFDSEEEREASLEVEGHVFLVSMRDATAANLASSALPASKPIDRLLSLAANCSALFGTAGGNAAAVADFIAAATEVSAGGPLVATANEVKRLRASGSDMNRTARDLIRALVH